MRTPRHGPLLTAWALTLVVSSAGCADPATGEREPGDSPPEDLASIRTLLDDDRYREAEQQARSAIARRESAVPPDERGLAQALNLLVEAQWRRGHASRPETRELAERAVTRGEELGLGGVELAVSLKNLAIVRALGGDDGAARPLYQRALEILEGAAEPDPGELASTLSSLANLMVRARELEAARALQERALEIRRETFGDEAREVAASLNNLGMILVRSGDAAGAADLYGRALAIQDVTLAPAHRDRATTLNNLANLARAAGNFVEALDLYRRALSIKEAVLDPDHPELAQSMGNLAALLGRLGEYEEARPLLERALRIRESAYGPMHPAVAGSLNNLANIDRRVGRYNDARAAYERALRILETTQGPDHPHVARALSNLANVLANLGELGEAIDLQERALSIREKQLAADSRDIAASLNNLGLLHKDVGDYGRADSYLSRALAAKEKGLGADHPDVALLLNNVGILRARMGRLDEARDLLRRALEIQERALGVDTLDVATTLDHLGIVNLRSGDPMRARMQLERALAIVEGQLDGDHPDRAEILFNLGEALQELGEPGAALPRYEEALRIRRAVLGRGHPEVPPVLVGIAELRLRGGERSLALESALEAESIVRDNLRTSARSLSERQALHYEAIRHRGLDVALSALVMAGPGVAAELRRIWDHMIRSRALVLDEVARRQRRVLESDDPELVARWRDLERSRGLLARLQVLGARGEEQRYALRIDETREEVDRAERELARRSSVFRQELRDQELGFEEVAGSLPRDTSLVAFARYHRIKPRGAEARQVPSYLALVLPAPDLDPVVVDLGPAAEIDDAIRRWQKAVGSDPRGDEARVAGAETEYRTAGKLLRRAVWDPVEAHLGDSRLVILVPDGPLHLVSFITLPDERGGYLVESGPLLHRVSAERDLAADPPRTGSGLLLVGGPDFDAALENRAERGPDANPRDDRPCTEGLPDHFPPLPGAQAEAAEVSALLVASGSMKDEEILSLIGAQATETAVKENAPGRRFLHLATHAFLGGPDCPASTPVADPSFGLGRPTLQGLALAGANGGAADRRRNHEDGILTAEEIASLDLRAAEWVVLSACDTGVGELMAGEGVLGLQRAFRIAGAGTLVMTLWPVADHATRFWMRELYGARLRGLSMADARRSASLAILAEQRRRGGTTHPFLWGAFLASGDWR